MIDLAIRMARTATCASGGEEKLLHQGIAERNFKRIWTLSPTVRVTGAQFEDGFLSVFLKNEIPEEAKPKTIKINNSTSVIL